MSSFYKAISIPLTLQNRKLGLRACPRGPTSLMGQAGLAPVPPVEPVRCRSLWLSGCPWCHSLCWERVPRIRWVPHTRTPTGPHGLEAGGHCGGELSRALDGLCCGCWAPLTGSGRPEAPFRGLWAGCWGRGCRWRRGSLRGHEVRMHRSYSFAMPPWTSSSHALHTCGPFSRLQVFKGSHLHAQSVS